MNKKKPCLKTTSQKSAMIEALVKSLGIVTIAAERVGISRRTHYDWYNEDPDYRKAVDDIADVTLDFAESKLHKQVDKGDTTAIIFLLKTRGKKRGYVERVEQTGADGKDLIPKQPTKEELLAELELIQKKRDEAK